MGVTINYGGRLRSDNDYDTVIKKAVNFATKNEMEFEFIKEDNKQLLRTKDEEPWDYQGRVRGIKIQPDENTDPLWLEFDNNNYLQDYCKTQFTEIEVHIKIIELFRDLKVHFKELQIIDEGEYWDTNDSQLLQNKFNRCFEMMDDQMRQNENLKGPFRIAGGRIIDLMGVMA